MRAEIEQLLVLQDRDQRIKALQTEQRGLPRERKAQEDRLAVVKTQQEQTRQQLRDAEVERRKMELEVEAKRTAIARFRAQQQQTRKNDEYQALTNEIRHCEEQISGLEDRELVVMETIETLQKELALHDAAAKKAEAVFAHQVAELDRKAQTLQERLGALDLERSNLSSRADADLLDLYQRLFAKKGDSAIVALDHDVCGGCHMQVPVQTTAHLRANQLPVVQCPYCGRVLYLSH